MWLRVEFIPRLQPCAEGVLVRTAYIDGFRFRDCLCQFLFYLCLRLAENVLNQPLASLFIINASTFKRFLNILTAAAICSRRFNAVFVLRLSFRRSN